MSVRTLAATSVAVVSLFALGGCAQGSKGALKQSDFAKQYQSRDSVSKAWAQCIASELYSKPLTLSDAERKLFNATKPDKKVTASLETKSEQAGKACDAKGLKP